MVYRRIIPCLDVKEGRVVKGVNFLGLKDSGNPVNLAESYYNQGADEITFLDISATLDGRQNMAALASDVSKKIFIPFTIGGGIRSTEDARRNILNGADKVAINSAAIKRPELLEEISDEFGRQAVVAAIDAKATNQGRKVFINAGTINTKIDAVDWAIAAEQYGAGELLITSIDRDGTKSGFDVDLYAEMEKAVGIPIIASGGGGDLATFSQLFNETEVAAALAASIFHYGINSVQEVKSYLKDEGVNVRL